MRASPRPWLALPLPPRVELRASTTPLEAAPRFSAAIGAEVWLKRDDIGPIGLAGNKVRKLEFLAADAQVQGATILVTIGARQSNHARTTAAAAARLGLRCHLVLGGGPVAVRAGNLLLDDLFGATIELVASDDWEELALVMERRCATLAAAGERPYPIPMGGSTALGALGLTAGYLELLGQLDEAGVDAAAIYHASSSGGTQAGLLLGQAIAGRGAAIRGVDVAKGTTVLEVEVATIASDAATLIGHGARWRPADITIAHDQVGPGYAQPTEAARAAARALARAEGIVVDPVYSAKALAGLVADVRSGVARGPLVFWHTGGIPAIFAPEYAAWATSDGPLAVQTG